MVLKSPYTLTTYVLPRNERTLNSNGEQGIALPFAVDTSTAEVAAAPQIILLRQYRGPVEVLVV